MHHAFDYLPKNTHGIVLNLSGPSPLPRAAACFWGICRLGEPSQSEKRTNMHKHFHTSLASRMFFGLQTLGPNVCCSCCPGLTDRWPVNARDHSLYFQAVGSFAKNVWGSEKFRDLVRLELSFIRMAYQTTI